MTFDEKLDNTGLEHLASSLNFPSSETLRLPRPFRSTAHCAMTAERHTASSRVEVSVLRCGSVLVNVESLVCIPNSRHCASPVSADFLRDRERISNSPRGGRARRRERSRPWIQQHPSKPQCTRPWPCRRGLGPAGRCYARSAPCCRTRTAARGCTARTRPKGVKARLFRLNASSSLFRI